MKKDYKAFLNCAIPHLYGGHRKDDFVFELLVKLAGITKRDNGQSDFENMMRCSFWVSRDAYSKYLGMYTLWMSQNVQSALESILVYLLRLHETDQIQFEIICKKK